MVQYDGSLNLEAIYCGQSSLLVISPDEPLTSCQIFSILNSASHSQLIYYKFSLEVQRVFNDPFLVVLALLLHFFNQTLGT